MEVLVKMEGWVIFVSASIVVVNQALELYSGVLWQALHTSILLGVPLVLAHFVNAVTRRKQVVMGELKVKNHKFYIWMFKWFLWFNHKSVALLGLMMNHRLNFEAIADHDSCFLSPIMDYEKTLYQPGWPKFTLCTDQWKCYFGNCTYSNECEPNVKVTFNVNQFLPMYVYKLAVFPCVVS